VSAPSNETVSEITPRELQHLALDTMAAGLRELRTGLSCVPDEAASRIQTAAMLISSAVSVHQEANASIADPRVDDLTLALMDALEMPGDFQSSRWAQAAIRSTLRTWFGYEPELVEDARDA
jgi:hypothetical protein